MPPCTAMPLATRVPPNVPRFGSRNTSAVVPLLGAPVPSASSRNFTAKRGAAMSTVDTLMSSKVKQNARIVIRVARVRRAVAEREVVNFLERSHVIGPVEVPRVSWHRGGVVGASGTIRVENARDRLDHRCRRTAAAQHADVVDLE